VPDSLADDQKLTRFKHEFQRNSGSREMVEHEDGEWVRFDDVDGLLQQINMWACYASEENTEARATALLEIGKLARLEKAGV